MCCFWFLQAKINDFPESSWVIQNDVLDLDSNMQYLISYYWAFQTLTTVGYGDISCANYVEQIMAMCWIIFGVAFYSYMIGNIINMITTMDKENLELQERIDIVKRFCDKTPLLERT
jgi:hypothetical protein